MNLLNLNIPGITKDKDDNYYFQGESCETIMICADKFGYRILHIEFRVSDPEAAVHMIEKFGFDDFKNYTQFMESKIKLTEPNGLGKLELGKNDFVLKLTVYKRAIDALINQGKLISVNCDGVKTLELID
jgi:hypothetical protein